MCPKYHEYSHIGSREGASITEDKNEVYSCPSSIVTSLQLSRTVCTTPQSSVPMFVYSRRKLQGNASTSAVFSAQDPASTKRSGEDCVSVVSYCAPSLKEQHVVSQAELAIEDPNMPYIAGKGESCVMKLESLNGCSLVEERVSDQASKSTEQKIIEVDSINDSCSSSKSDMELVSASMHTQAEDTSECSSSSAMFVEALGEELSEKDLCTSVVRSKGVFGRVWPSRTHGSAEGVGDSSASSSSRFCKLCAHLESPLKMLICDNCEESFHLSCCNPRIKRIPQDEWFCHSCAKKRRKILTETVSTRFSNMIGEKGRSGNSYTDESNPIALMLRDTPPYTTGVRIGKGFQAEVSDWSIPITEYVLFIIPVFLFLN
ncbi:conserved hypothetical protein [Ricinus communis]|uniref:PHD-type domain-containing protein n=1 Tax=Ricinus communis TaxID=3988 RepID=B9SP83_RICCO|nr:conserved hypothetical protein [Ricinus communis]